MKLEMLSGITSVLIVLLTGRFAAANFYSVMQKWVLFDIKNHKNGKTLLLSTYCKRFRDTHYSVQVTLKVIFLATLIIIKLL
jgi:cytoplasmic iron level regulating protein YaaA (DUF328/UPF0246 family)